MIVSPMRKEFSRPGATHGYLGLSQTRIFLYTLPSSTLELGTWKTGARTRVMDWIAGLHGSPFF